MGITTPGSVLVEASRPDWAEEVEACGGKIDADGTMLLWHGTTKEKAASILREKVMRRPKDAPDTYGVFFTTNKEFAEETYGDGTAVPVRVRVRDLRIEDTAPGRWATLYAQTRGGIYRPVAVGSAAVREATESVLVDANTNEATGHYISPRDIAGKSAIATLSVGAGCVGRVDEAKSDAELAKTFGITTNVKEAGYILRDGRLLDFSGKNDGSAPGQSRVTSI